MRNGTRGLGWFLLFAVLSMSSNARTATVTWTGLGADNNWSSPANWSGGAVPGAGGDVVFDGTSTKACTVDVDPTINSLDLQAGFAGGGGLNAGAHTITVAGNVTIASTAGLFVKGTSTVDMTGTGSLSNPNFSNLFYKVKLAAAGQTTTMTGDVRCAIFELGTGTLNHIAGTIRTGNQFAGKILINAGATITGSPAVSLVAPGGPGVLQTLDGGNWPGAAFQAAAGSGSTFRLLSDLRASTLFVRGDSTFDANGFNVSLTNQLNLGLGAKSPAFTCGSGAIDVGNFHLVTAGGNPVLNLDSSRFFCAANWTVDPGGTVNPGTSTVTFRGANGGGWQITSAGQPFANVVFGDGNPNNANAYYTLNGDMRVKGDLTITSESIWKFFGSTLFIEGDLSSADVSVGGTAALTLDGALDQTIDIGSGDVPDGTFTVDKAAGVASLLSPLALNGVGQDLTVASGMLDLLGFDLTVPDVLTIGAAGVLRLQGGETVTRSSVLPQTGSEVIYNGTGTYPSLAVGNSYFNLTFDGTGSWTHTGLLDVNGSLNIIQGTLDSAGQDVNVAGNWSNTGTYTSGTNTVTLDGGNQALNGNTTFYNLAKNSPGATLTFANGTTQIIVGTLALQGASGNLMQIVSDIPGPGNEGFIEAQGPRNSSYLNVTDNHNLTPPRILSLLDSTDGGNSDGWFDFPPVAVIGGSGPFAGSVPLTVSFDGTGSYDPDGDVPLTYQWDFDDGSPLDTTATPAHTYTVPGVFTVTLIVTDDSGTPSAPVTIQVEVSVGGELKVLRARYTLNFAARARWPDERVDGFSFRGRVNFAALESQGVNLADFSTSSAAASVGGVGVAFSLPLRRTAGRVVWQTNGGVKPFLRIALNTRGGTFSVQARGLDLDDALLPLGALNAGGTINAAVDVPLSLSIGGWTGAQVLRTRYTCRRTDTVGRGVFGYARAGSELPNGIFFVERMRILQRKIGGAWMQKVVFTVCFREFGGADYDPSGGNGPRVTLGGYTETVGDGSVGGALFQADRGGRVFTYRRPRSAPRTGVSFLRVNNRTWKVTGATHWMAAGTFGVAAVLNPAFDPRRTVNVVAGFEANGNQAGTIARLARRGRNFSSVARGPRR